MRNKWRPEQLLPFQIAGAITEAPRNGHYTRRCEIKHVIDYAIIASTGLGCPHIFDNSGNGLEMEALKRMIPRLNDGPRIRSYCRNNHAKKTDVMKKSAVHRSQSREESLRKKADESLNEPAFGLERLFQKESACLFSKCVGPFRDRPF
jgi:hypothetical protein